MSINTPEQLSSTQTYVNIQLIVFILQRLIDGASYISGRTGRLFTRV